MSQRKITQVLFREGVGKGSYKSFDIAQPVLNTGAEIKDIKFAEENRGILVQWTDRQNRRNVLLVPWGNIKNVEFDASTVEQTPTEIPVKSQPTNPPKKN